MSHRRRKVRKIAFLCGAGASYGAGRITPHPPPLVRNLYEELLEEFPESWGSLPSKDQENLTKNFEAGMEELWNTKLGVIQRLMLDLAIFFSKFDPAPDGSDCYSRLIKVIVEKDLTRRTAFATLNYECILEIAASRHGLKLTYRSDVVPRDNLRVWKLHGSCNILPKAEIYNLGFEARKIFRGPIEVVNTTDVRAKYQGGLAVPPVMGVIAPGKPTQTMGEFLDLVRADWRAWAVQAQRIFVIGATPLLSEEYVWQPILDSEAKVLYIGGHSGDYESLRRSLGGRLRYVAHDFEQGFDLIVHELAVSGSEPTGR